MLSNENRYLNVLLHRGVIMIFTVVLAYLVTYYFTIFVCDLHTQIFDDNVDLDKQITHTHTFFG